MNETVNMFFLVGDKLMLEILLKQPGFTSAACGPFKKKEKKKSKCLCRRETPTLFTEISLIMLVFNTIWLMANQKTEKKELNQTKF